MVGVDTSGLVVSRSFDLVAKSQYRNAAADVRYT